MVEAGARLFAFARGAWQRPRAPPSNMRGFNMKRSDELRRGKDSLNRKMWSTAFQQLSSADRNTPLPPEDIEALAMAAQMSGRDAESNELLMRAHRNFLEADDVHGAARCAIFLGFKLSLAGEYAQAGGWLARARRLLADQPECVEYGYLLLSDGLGCVLQGETAAGAELFERAAAIGHRFQDKDLTARALMGHGRALIRRGNFAEGVALLDEAMIAVTAGEVSPLTAGSVYCSVIESCRETLDLRRAHEWTSALSEWCESQPEVMLFRGACLLHRA